MNKRIYQVIKKNINVRPIKEYYVYFLIKNKTSALFIPDTMDTFEGKVFVYENVVEKSETTTVPQSVINTIADDQKSNQFLFQNELQRNTQVIKWRWRGR